MKTFGGTVEVKLHTFLTLALDGGEMFHPSVASPLGDCRYQWYRGMCVPTEQIWMLWRRQSIAPAGN
jgi:hypothetical protein